MNHDATHCSDYKKTKCPKSCYRAELTEELKHICYPLPTSWASFEGTAECPKYKINVQEEKNELQERSL